MSTVLATSSSLALAADAPGVYSSWDELGGFFDAAYIDETAETEAEEPPYFGEAVAGEKPAGRGPGQVAPAPDGGEPGQDSGRARGPELATAEQTDRGNQRALKREDPGVVLTADQGRAL